MDAEDLAGLIREFVALFERADRMRPYDVLVACAQLLPRIYAGGLALPAAEPDDTAPAPCVPPPRLPSFGSFDIYSEIYDPYVEDGPVMASLAGDLSEIYSDLVGPLREFEAGRTANAVWSWRFNIRGHCGDHLVDAVRAIHRAVNDHMPDDYGITPASDPIFELDGTRISTLEEFFAEVSRVLIPGSEWGHNLDAFNDILRGGFGTPEGGFTIRWRHHAMTVARLGYAETVRQLELRLARCHPTNRAFVTDDLARARRGQGPTVFEWLLEIIRCHGPGGREAGDNVTLELR
jgi:RNAse (barnase) inhibitor barstar